MLRFAKKCTYNSLFQPWNEQALRRLQRQFATSSDVRQTGCLFDYMEQKLIIEQGFNNSN